MEDADTDADADADSDADQFETRLAAVTYAVRSQKRREDAISESTSRAAHAATAATAATAFRRVFGTPLRSTAAPAVCSAPPPVPRRRKRMRPAAEVGDDEACAPRAATVDAAAVSDATVTVAAALPEPEFDLLSPQHAARDIRSWLHAVRGDFETRARKPRVLVVFGPTGCGKRFFIEHAGPVAGVRIDAVEDVLSVPDVTAWLMRHGTTRRVSAFNDMQAPRALLVHGADLLLSDSSNDGKEGASAVQNAVHLLHMCDTLGVHIVFTATSTKALHMEVLRQPERYLRHGLGTVVRCAPARADCVAAWLRHTWIASHAHSDPCGADRGIAAALAEFTGDLRQALRRLELASVCGAPDRCGALTLCASAFDAASAILKAEARPPTAPWKWQPWSEVTADYPFALDLVHANYATTAADDLHTMRAIADAADVLSELTAGAASWRDGHKVDAGVRLALHDATLMRFRLVRQRGAITTPAKLMCPRALKTNVHVKKALLDCRNALPSSKSLALHEASERLALWQRLRDAAAKGSVVVPDGMTAACYWRAMGVTASELSDLKAHLLPSLAASLPPVVAL